MQTMKIQFNKKLGLEKGIFVVPVFQEELNKTNAQYPHVVKDFLSFAIKPDCFIFAKA